MAFRNSVWVSISLKVNLPSPDAIRESAWAGDSTTSSLIPSTNVPYKVHNIPQCHTLIHIKADQLISHCIHSTDTKPAEMQNKKSDGGGS